MISSTHIVRALREANLKSYVVVENLATSPKFEQIVKTGLSLCRYKPLARSSSIMHGTLEVLGVNFSDNAVVAEARSFLASRTYTLEQAIREFRKMPQQLLLIGAFAIIKSLEVAVETIGLGCNIEGIPISVRNGPNPFASSIMTVTPTQVIAEMSRLTGSIISIRHQFPLYVGYLEQLIVGTKVTTVRFRQSAIEIPANTNIPVYQTEDFGPGKRSQPTAVVGITAISYSRYGDLNAADAVRDGFQSLAAMRKALATIYQHISDDSWLTIYNISPILGISRLRNRQ